MQALSTIMKSSTAGLAVTLLLAAALIANVMAVFPHQFGVDFYHFWGIPLVKQGTATAQSPYADPHGYARALNEIADASSNQKLRNANHYRRHIEPTATPFLYACFAFLPADYERAQALFAIIAYLAAGFGIYLLARLRALAKWPAIWLALLTELTFNPFVQDVKVGNVNSLQLAFIAALLHVAVRRRYGGNVFVAGLFIGLLTVFVIFKPNTTWIALALAIHYWVVRGSRSFFVGVGVAAVLSAVAFAIGAGYFNHVSVWLEWLGYARGIGSGALPFSFEQGNQSLPMLLANLGMSYGPTGYGLIIAISMLVALLLALTSNGRAGKELLANMRDAFSDPWFAASIGVLFTFATSPLVWPHYHLFALIPIFWLVRTDGKLDMATLGAVICYGALSRPLINLLLAAEFYGVLQLVMLFAWVPLMPGVFLYAARPQPCIPA